MTEYHKENITTLKRSFIRIASTLILAKFLGLFFIDFFFSNYVINYISIFWTITTLVAVVLMYSQSFKIIYENFFITATFFHLILLSIVNILYYKHFPALASEYLIYTISLLNFINTNKAFFITMTLVLGAFLSYLIPLEYKYVYISNYIEIKGLFLVTLNIIIGSIYLYFVIHIKRLEAVILYIENREFNLDKLGFYRPKLLFGNYKDDLKKSSIDAYKTLFNQIEEYMRLNQPWLDPEYSIEQLAREMKTNTTYISQSINIYAKANFRAYINQFRLNCFIQLIDTDEKLSIRDAYIQSGFNNQATFNRVFKNKYNDNPQEYIDNLQRKKIGIDL